MPDDTHTRAFHNRTHMAELHPISYYTSEITDTLNEWNESAVFELDPVVVMPTEQGVTVTGVMWHSEEWWDTPATAEEPVWRGYRNRQLDGQFIAIYGDEDKLCYLAIMTNPGTEVLIDHTIRG